MAFYRSKFRLQIVPTFFIFDVGVRQGQYYFMLLVLTYLSLEYYSRLQYYRLQLAVPLVD